MIYEDDWVTHKILKQYLHSMQRKPKDDEVVVVVVVGALEEDVAPAYHAFESDGVDDTGVSEDDGLDLE